MQVKIKNVARFAGQLASGQFRAIAQAGSKPWPELPATPTFAQLGIENADFDTFQAMFAPSGTPAGVVDRLVRELTEILKRAETRERLRAAGLETLAEGPELFSARIAREMPLYKEIIDKAALRIK